MARVRLLATIATLARTGTIAGLVVAALIYPIAAVAGLSLKRGATEIGGDLDQLKISPLSQVSKIYAADGKTLITQFYEEYRIPVSIEAISPHMRHAIVAAEDVRFLEHNGVDMRRIDGGIVVKQRAGGWWQGAVKITMQ
jgi:membrane carboxypeptidase/penicillin-binding protein